MFISTLKGDSTENVESSFGCDDGVCGHSLGDPRRLRSGEQGNPSLTKLKVDFAPPTVWPVKGGRSAIERPIRSARVPQVSRTNPSSGRTRSKTRIVAGAMPEVGGFCGRISRRSHRR